MFWKICVFRSWKGSHIQTLFYWKSTPFKTLPEWNNLCRLCNKWSSCLPVSLNIKEIISNHYRPVCSGQGGGEETVLSTTITVTRTLYFKDKKKTVLNDRKKVVNIVPDKLQSTLGLKLPPIFTLLPCLASRPGLLPGWQGGRHALQGHHGPKYHLLHMVQLGGAHLEFF